MSRLVYVKKLKEETNLVLFNLCAHFRMANSQSFKFKLKVELKLEKCRQKKTDGSIS
jgi:NTP pyrophosphatase (non-canonical NTP hydrolase)